VTENKVRIVQRTICAGGISPGCTLGPLALQVMRYRYPGNCNVDDRDDGVARAREFVPYHNYGVRMHDGRDHGLCDQSARWPARAPRLTVSTIVSGVDVAANAI
jgi:hypothetical protein